MKKLSKAQIALLEDAYLQLEHDTADAYRGLCSHPGWFFAQTKYRETGLIICRPQTAASLCDLGLMEGRPHLEPYWHKGKRRQDIEYRISEAGIKYVKDKAYLVIHVPKKNEAPAALDWRALEEEYGQHG
jgi:hypothetical protein